MKPSEATVLLTAIARTDQRTVAESTARSWADLMTEADVPLKDAIEAVRHHFGTSRDYLMPIHIIDHVREIRRERLQRAGTPPMPADLTWKQEKTWRTLWCENVKDGMSITEAADAASDQMDLPRELPPGTSDAVAAERQALVQKLADSKAAPRPEPEQRRPDKPRERWGCWLRGTPQVVDDTDVIVYSSAGVVLFHGNDPWGIEIRDLRGDLAFWLNHVASKGWGDSATLTALARAWCDLTGADDGLRAWAVAMVANAIDPKAEEDSMNRAHPTGGAA